METTVNTRFMRAHKTTDIMEAYLRFLVRISEVPRPELISLISRVENEEAYKECLKIFNRDK